MILLHGIKKNKRHAERRVYNIRLTALPSPDGVYVEHQYRVYHFCVKYYQNTSTFLKKWKIQSIDNLDDISGEYSKRLLKRILPNYRDNKIEEILSD